MCSSRMLISRTGRPLLAAASTLVMAVQQEVRQQQVLVVVLAFEARRLADIK